MSIETNLDRAFKALFFLRNSIYSKETHIPPECFFSGLSVILGYIENDIAKACNEYTRTKDITR